MYQREEVPPVNLTKTKRIGKRKLWEPVKPARRISAQEDLSSCLIAAGLCPQPIPAPRPAVNLPLFWVC
jgi:hypothetical protein